MTPLEAATGYKRRGWAVIPVPHQSKNPGYDGWQRSRFPEEDLPQYFNGQPQNIGVLMGEPSGWLVDVDLDHLRCVALADEVLPPTPAIFGRPGKPRSHRLYRVSGPIKSRRIKSKSAGTLVELRSTGGHTVAPHSTHESGEPIAWELGGEDAEPPLLDPAELMAAVERLGATVLIELGERSAPRPPKPPKPAPGPTKTEQKNAARITERVRMCVDAMVRMHMTDQNDGSGRLFAAACRVVEHDLDDAHGITAVRDFARRQPFPQEWSDEQIVARIRDAEDKTERGVIRKAGAEGKTKVLIDPDEHRAVSETVDALTVDKTIFQRGGALVRVIREASPPGAPIRRSAGTATIACLPQAALRERMTRFVQFTQRIRRGDVVVEVLAHPTQWLVGAVDARGEWPGIRTLAGVSDVPVLRPDGSLWQQAGYDEQTGVLYEPSAEFPPVPEDVTLDDASGALEQLLEIVHDFRFEGDDHRAAWLAGMLTPSARFAFDGPSPLFLIDANIRGAGKGLLAQTIGEVNLGREMPVSSYAHDPEEMRKKITSTALAGDRLVLLDNLEGTFGNDAIDRALTSTRWSDRILGKSQNVDLPLISVWYGTGNNVAVAADTTRRIIHVRLDVLSERPEERDGFRHPELITWIKQHRPRLLVAALTILRAYCNAGRPRQGLAPFGSFEGWSKLVREAVVWVGMPDPCNTRVKLAEHADTTADALGQLIAAWPGVVAPGNGIVVSELLNRLYAKPPAAFPPVDEGSNAMRAALENLVGCPPGRTPGPRQVGAKFRHFRRRPLGGFYIDTNPDEYDRNGAVWRLHNA